MSDIALLMTGVLTTRQVSTLILTEQLLVQLNNDLENSKQGQLSQIVLTAQITPPEFMEPDETFQVAPSALTLENENILKKIKKKIHSKSSSNLAKSAKEINVDALIHLDAEPKTLRSIEGSAKLSATRNTAVSYRLRKQKSVADQRLIGKDGNKIVVTKSQFASPSLPTLRFGNSGVAIRVLQRLLVSNGYTIQVDGVFGALTEAAVKAFQNKRNIVVDGVVGQRTWRELTR